MNVECYFAISAFLAVNSFRGVGVFWRLPGLKSHAVDVTIIVIAISRIVTVS